jgi:hypothetical protein
MKRYKIMFRVFILFFVLQSLSTAWAVVDDKKQTQLYSAEIDSIKEAIQDEIYDYGYYKDYLQIGKNIGTPAHWISQSPMYINLINNADGESGEVIYKYMPFGEIDRLFHFGRGKKVILDGNPQNEFPKSQPSQKTIFMDQEDVFEREAHSIKGFFLIDAKPNVETIKKASQRQKERVGFSDWEFKKLNPE